MQAEKGGGVAEGMLGGKGVCSLPLSSIRLDLAHNSAIGRHAASPSFFLSPILLTNTPSMSILYLLLCLCLLISIADALVVIKV